MTLLLRASRQFFYRHPAQLLLALIGIAAGVAVVSGVILMRSVLVDSIDSAARSLTGDEALRVIAQSNDGLDERLYAELAGMAGSPPLQAFVSARVSTPSGRLEILATDPLSAGSQEQSGLNPAAAGALLSNPESVILNQATAERIGVVEGERFEVRYQGRDLTLEALSLINGAAWLDNRLLMDLAAAQHLLDRAGRLSWISAPPTAQSWLAERLPDEVSLQTADQRRDSVRALTRGMQTNLTALSLLALVVGLFVVHAVLSFLHVQRQRQFGLLRALGVTPAGLSAWLLAEALLLALIGSLIGLAAGAELAVWMLALIQAPVSELYGLVAGQQVAASWTVYLGVLGLTLTLTLISVTGLVREALRIPPGQLARSQPATRRGRLAWLLAPLLAAAGALVLLSSDGLIAALIALLIWLAGCALLIPALGMALLGLPGRLAPGSLPARALGMLRASRQRLSPTLAALALALGLSAGMALMVGGFRVAVDDWVTRLLQADVYVSVSGAEFTPEAVAGLADWQALAAWSSVRQSSLPDGTPMVAYDLPAIARNGFDFLDPEAPDWSGFDQGQAVMVSEPLARLRGLQRGSTISIATPGRMRELSIGGIYRDYASDRGQVALAGPQYRRWFGDQARDSIGLYLAPGQDVPDAVSLAERLGLSADRLNLTERSAVRDTTLAVFDRTFQITRALAALVGLIAIVSLVSALLALGLERQREYATLRALGLTPAGLAGWIAVQTVGLALVAAALAIPVSALIHGALSLAVQPRAFGWSVPLSFSALPWLSLLPLALISGLLASVIPALKLLRQPPARQLRGG